jgi:N-acyl-D-aspartate/D-glutamate deacylase
MEGVGDIPGSALAEGITWEWESFPECLDAIEKRHLAVDFGTQISDGAVRGYAMVERGARNEEADEGDFAAVARRRGEDPLATGLVTPALRDRHGGATRPVGARRPLTRHLPG